MGRLVRLLGMLLLLLLLLLQMLLFVLLFVLLQLGRLMKRDMLLGLVVLALLE